MSNTQNVKINLIEKITRNKIYNSIYYKEHCFGLTAESLIDKATELESIGGSYGGSKKVNLLIKIKLANSFFMFIIKNASNRTRI
jgi:hypothetical protein